MALDAKKSYTTVYFIKMEFIINKVDPFEPLQIKSLSKTFNFFSDLFPIFEAKALIPSKYFKTMFTNQHNMYVHLVIKRQKRGAGGEGSDLQTSLGEPMPIFEETFIPFFYKESFSPNVEEDVSTEDGENTNGSPETSLTREMRFALYSYTGLVSNKDFINYVLAKGDEGTDVGTAMKLIISKSGFKKFGCIIDKPSNEQKFKYIVIPPHNFLMALRDLQIRYGIYAKALEVFYDPPMLYILEKYNNSHDYKENTTHEAIFEVTSTRTQPVTPTPIEELDDASQRYRLSAMPQKQVTDVYDSELYGDTIIYTNFDLGKSMLKYKTTDPPETSEFDSYVKPIESFLRDVQKHDKTGAKVKFEYDELNNPFNMTSWAFETSPHLRLLITGIDFIDYLTFKPNTSIVLQFIEDKVKDAETGGKYNIQSGVINFTQVNQNNNDYVCSINDLVLVKAGPGGGNANVVTKTAGSNSASSGASASGGGSSSSSAAASSASSNAAPAPVEEKKGTDPAAAAKMSDQELYDKRNAAKGGLDKQWKGQDQPLQDEINKRINNGTWTLENWGKSPR